MNPVNHSQLSVSRWGGVLEDYLPIHSFIDHTKSLCPDMRHRILHTNWAINYILIPLFGHTLMNAEGKVVDVKDLCEKDHILPDFQNKFIPTIADFSEAIDENKIDNYKARINQFHKQYTNNTDLAELMLSPLAHTGTMKSLLFTHNSWFVNMIAPKVVGSMIRLEHFDLSPSTVFNAMHFEPWMDNGICLPASAALRKSVSVL